MAKGYWIARVSVDDMEKYKDYVAANAEPFAKYNARFVVRAGQFECKEGDSRPRNVVIEFDSYEDALACYDSPEYQAAKVHRDGVSIADLIVVEGVD